MIVKNYAQLAINELRRDALEIVDAGLSAINTPRVVRGLVRVTGSKLTVSGREIDLNPLKRIYVIGIGKCALDACTELEKILGNHISDGIVLDVRPGTISRMKTFVGTHPFPSQANVDATEKIIQMLKNCKQDDLVLFVISGGGSTLICQPEKMSWSDEEKIIKHLFAKAATIQEINTIRKHLSLARGGFLAKYAFPAKSLALIFSDVPGNELSNIASGPTVFDSTTVDDAKTVLSKYDVNDFTGLIETPKDPGLFNRMENILALSNKTALGEMKARGEQLGFNVQIVTDKLIGEASEIGKDIASQIKKAPPKTLLLYAGETTVTKRGNGKGGRNQELVLSVLQNIGKGNLLISIASDGRDNGDFAGAIADSDTAEHASRLNLSPNEFLETNDSSSFFVKTGDYILTNSTGLNVSDLVLAMKD